MDKDFKNRDKVSGDGDNKDGFVNGDDGDGGDQDVDEHHQHATILRQLQELKSSVMVRADEAGKPIRYFAISTSLGRGKWCPLRARSKLVCPTLIL